MSVCHWMIEGIGIKAEMIEPHLNIERVVALFLEKFPGDEELEEMVSTGDYSGFDMGEYLHGNCFENLGEVLWHCDDTDALTYGDDGEGTSYFYYRPSMPWHHTEAEPKSEQDVIDRIVNAVQKIADIPAEEIVKMIDTDLYVYGCG